MSDATEGLEHDEQNEAEEVDESEGVDAGEAGEDGADQEGAEVIPPPPSLPAVLMQPQNRAVGRQLAFFMLLMLLIPIAIYFICHDWLLAGTQIAPRCSPHPLFPWVPHTPACVSCLIPCSFHFYLVSAISPCYHPSLSCVLGFTGLLDDSNRMTVSGLLAVLAVKVVSTIYAVKAWREERAERQVEQEQEVAADQALDALVSQRLSAAASSAAKKTQ
jgi:hypothetical protein